MFVAAVIKDCGVLAKLFVDPDYLVVNRVGNVGEHMVCDSFASL